jgi:hypothetical protein
MCRPGHKKALRSKGHHRSNNVSMDATGDCCDQLESVALVINCEDWSESSGSGTDWAAGPPRWNHVFVIPNYKEVGQRLRRVHACKHLVIIQSLCPFAEHQGWHMHGNASAIGRAAAHQHS